MCLAWGPRTLLSDNLLSAAELSERTLVSDGLFCRWLKHENGICILIICFKLLNYQNALGFLTICFGPLNYQNATWQNKLKRQNKRKSRSTAKMWLAEGQPDRQISVDSSRRLLLDSVFAIHRRSTLKPRATPIDKNAYEVHFFHFE